MESHAFVVGIHVLCVGEETCVHVGGNWTAITHLVGLPHVSSLLRVAVRVHDAVRPCRMRCVGVWTRCGHVWVCNACCMGEGAGSSVFVGACIVVGVCGCEWTHNACAHELRGCDTCVQVLRMC